VKKSIPSLAAVSLALLAQIAAAETAPPVAPTDDSASSGNSNMPFDFKTYLQAFNGADEATFVRDSYTEDLVVEGPPGVMHGHQEWLTALTFIHDRIEERLYPVTVMQDGDTILAELKGVFTATADRKDFPFGPLKKGESITVKMLAKYVVRGSKIAHITLASWPSGDTAK
jgi:hypothetical protein